MANSLLNTAQQLKGMIEHAKLQAEAAKDAAITQVKLQAEAEKKEVTEQETLFVFLQVIIPRQTVSFFLCVMVLITIVGCVVEHIMKHFCSTSCILALREINCMSVIRF